MITAPEIQKVLENQFDRATAAISEGFCPVHGTKLATEFERHMERDTEPPENWDDWDDDAAEEGGLVTESGIGHCGQCQAVWVIGTDNLMRESLGCEFIPRYKDEDGEHMMLARMEFYR